MDDVIEVKLVTVGDIHSGKTSLLFAYSRNEFPRDHLPTIFDTYIKPTSHEGIKVNLALLDTAGKDDYDRLRPLSYPNTHVVLMCFSVDDPNSLQNISDKWHPEIKHFCPGVPIIVVGNKADVRDDRNVLAEMSRKRMKPVQNHEGHDIARQIGAQCYMECSAKRKAGVREIFREAVRLALMYQKMTARNNEKCRIL